jgi:hypothetical protein
MLLKQIFVMKLILQRLAKPPTCGIVDLVTWTSKDYITWPTTIKSLVYPNSHNYSKKFRVVLWVNMKGFQEKEKTKQKECWISYTQMFEV